MMVVVFIIIALAANNLLPAQAKVLLDNNGRGGCAAAAAECCGALQARMETLEMKMKEQEKAVEQRKTTTIKWRFCNPKNNQWAKRDNAATTPVPQKNYNVFAVHPFTVEPAGECGAQEGEETLVQIKYFEVTAEFYQFRLGLSATNGSELYLIGDYPHSYAYIDTANVNGILNTNTRFFYSGYTSELQFQWPGSTIKPILNLNGRHNIFGCGLVIWGATGRRAIFFTVNGILLGQIDINAADLPLYPAISLSRSRELLATNFGDRPFLFDVIRFPGVNFAQDDN